MKNLTILLLLPLLACSSGASVSATTGSVRLDDGSAAAVAHLRLDKMP